MIPEAAVDTQTRAMSALRSVQPGRTGTSTPLLPGDMKSWATPRETGCHTVFLPPSPQTSTEPHGVAFPQCRSGIMARSLLSLRSPEARKYRHQWLFLSSSSSVRGCATTSSLGLHVPRKQGRWEHPWGIPGTPLVTAALPQLSARPAAPTRTTSCATETMSSSAGCSLLFP